MREGTCYYSNGMRFIPSWIIALFVIAPAVWASFTSEGIAPKVMGLVFLSIPAGLAWFMYRHVTRPIVEVAGDQVAVRQLLRPRRELGSLEKYQLVVSNDYVAFRSSHGQDITIGRGELSARKWHELIEELRSLPITEYEGV